MGWGGGGGGRGVFDWKGAAPIVGNLITSEDVQRYLYTA